MEAKPAWEAMYIHGILHRIEGDYDNARAWYGNVQDSDALKAAWPGGLDEARKFIDGIEALRKRKEGNIAELEGVSRREIDSVVEFCREKFGTGEVKDASSIWVKSDKDHNDMAQAMVIGGEGWRNF